MNRNEKAFVNWVAKRHPKLAKRALLEAQRAAAMGEVAGFMDSFTSAIEKIAPTLIQAKAQKDLLKVQMDRAKAGQPPLDASQYSPAMRVQVEPTMTMPTWVKPVGIGLAALLGLKILTGMKRA